MTTEYQKLVSIHEQTVSEKQQLEQNQQSAIDKIKKLDVLSSELRKQLEVAKKEVEKQKAISFQAQTDLATNTRTLQLDSTRYKDEIACLKAELLQERKQLADSTRRGEQLLSQVKELSSNLEKERKESTDLVLQSKNVQTDYQQKLDEAAGTVSQLKAEAEKLKADLEKERRAGCS